MGEDVSEKLDYTPGVFNVEQHIRDMSAEQQRHRQKHAKPILDALHHKMIGQRQMLPEGSAIAKALEYGLRRWAALIRYLDDGHVPIDNNRVESQSYGGSYTEAPWVSFHGTVLVGRR